MNDALDLLDRPGTRIDVGAAQLGGQEMPAAEHVKRQVAVAIIVAMEKAAFLMPVDRVIGRVEVQDDLARGLGPEGIEEEVDKHGLDRGHVMPDLVIAPARGIYRRMLQPVERALASEQRGSSVILLEPAQP